jgi:hypothetical protein
MSTKISTSFSEGSFSQRHSDDFMVKPLVNFHGRIVSTFNSLPPSKMDKFKEIVKRIVTIVIAPFAYLGLSFAALIGIIFSKKKMFESEKSEETNPKKNRNVSFDIKLPEGTPIHSITQHIQYEGDKPTMKTSYTFDPPRIVVPIQNDQQPVAPVEVLPVNNNSPQQEIIIENS